MRRSLRTRLTILFLAVAILPLLLVAFFGIQQSVSVQSVQSVAQQNESARGIAISVSDYIQGAESELRLIINVLNVQDSSRNELTTTLVDMLSFSDVYNELILTDQKGNELAKASRDAVVEQGQLGNVAGTTKYEQPKETKETYYSEVTFDSLTGEPFMVLSIPIEDLRTGEISGVLIANLKLKTIWDLMSSASRSGQIVYMVDLSKRIVAHPNPSVVLQGAQFEHPEEGGILDGLNGERAALGVAPAKLNGQDTFYVVSELPASIALEASNNLTRLILTVLVITVLVISTFSVWQTRQFARPIEELVQTASAVESGNLDARVRITSSDEIGVLGSAFNQMTKQLQDTLSGLEQRVEERTAELEESSLQIQKRASQLEAIADVASSVASLQDMDQLLPYITQTVSERFGFYHAGIFLLSGDKRYAVLRAANSIGGQVMLARNHQLRVGQEGVVGFSVHQKRAHIALDVGEDAVYFNNPDLPDTRSEIALPLLVGSEVIGVLDVQSTEPNAFSSEDIGVLNILANQVAVAIQNARLFQQSQDSLKELDATFQRYISSEWRQFAEKKKLIGYRAHETGVEPITDKQNVGDTQKTKKATYTIPITLRGTTVGKLNVDTGKETETYGKEEMSLVQTIADRLALALESARLLEESQQTAAKEQVIGDITTKISSSINLRNLLQTAVEELGQAIPGSEIVIELQSDQSKATGVETGEIA